MKFYGKDWLASSTVSRMPLEARGAFIHLLCYQWEEGFIPDDREEIRLMLGCEKKALDRIWKYVDRVFPVDATDGNRYNFRCRTDRAKAFEKSAKATESANARWGANADTNGADDSMRSTDSPNANAYANASETQMPFACYPESEPEPIAEPLVSTTTAREDFGKTEPPPEPVPPSGPWWEFCDRSLFRDTMEAIRKVPVWKNVPVGDLPDESALCTVWEKFESRTGGSEDDFRYEVLKFTESSKGKKPIFNPPSALTSLANWLDKTLVPAPPAPPGNGKPWQQGRQRKKSDWDVAQEALAMVAGDRVTVEPELDTMAFLGYSSPESGVSGKGRA